MLYTEVMGLRFLALVLLCGSAPIDVARAAPEHGAETDSELPPPDTVAPTASPSPSKTPAPVPTVTAPTPRASALPLSPNTAPARRQPEDASPEADDLSAAASIPPILTTPTEPKRADNKPRVVARLVTPLKFTEEANTSDAQPGKATVTFQSPASKTDLESQIWKLGDDYNLESKIDVSQVNQSILPVDSYGKLTKEATALTGRPFIKYYLPDGTQKIIDIQCTKKQCRGLWKKFPYRADIPTKYQVEVNIRGLKGRNWQISFNQVQVEKGLVTLKPETVRLDGKHHYEKTRVYQRGLYVPPGAKSASEPDFIEEWAFDAAQGLTVSGAHRLGRITLIEIIEGPMVLDVVRGGESTLESVELTTGDRVWLPREAIIAIKAPRGGKIRRLEFTL